MNRRNISGMKTVIDIDDVLLEKAARELGTSTKKDTVNAALAFVAEQRERVRLLDQPGLTAAQKFGAGEDISDPEIMRGARR